MTANGKAVSHDAALMEYAITKDRAEFVTSHGLKSNPVLMFNLEASEIIAEFRQHQQNYQNHTRGRPLDNNILRFELCPTAEETLGWTRNDHAELVQEFISILDSLTNANTKKGTFSTPRTTVGNTQWVAMLHHDGANGCDHIHLLCNRIDRDGNTICDSYLQAKAEMAANILNERRHWKQSMDIGKEHRTKLRTICMDTLREMPRWDWDDYFHRLEQKGFEHFCRRESTGNKIRGYCLYWGNSSIPASEIDRGLTWGKIEGTWKRLHPELDQQKVGQANGKVKKPISTVGSNGNKAHGFVTTIPTHRPEMVHYDFASVLPSFRNKNNGTILSFDKHLDNILQKEIFLPDPNDYKNEEVDYVAPDRKDIAYVAVALFFGYVDAATSIAESHGGGGGDTSGWGKDKKDDYEEWMRRCARKASQLCAPRHHPRIRRGGWHR